MPKHVIESSEESFGERLARLRKAAGYTQKELGEEVGTSQRMVAYYEAQTEHPPTKLMPALAKALGVSADELLGLAAGRARRAAPDSRLDR
ncbi:MAG: helix-turn-helix transcriptional regulator, partial [Archangium sp.]|nr:helix-turn-helix transcriptional regulator [Archangium sp.]